MQSIALSDIPQQYKDCINNIKDPIIQKLYMNFSFSYFSQHAKCDQNHIQDFLIDFLKEFKFMTYEYFEFSEPVNISPAHQEHIVNSDHNIFNEEEKNIKVNAVICMEKQCFIIEQIELATIDEILKNTKSSLINVNRKNKREQLTSEEEYAQIETANFCSKFQKEISNNSFVKHTICAIASYSIRKFFYPSYFFKDQSFFNFDQQFTSYSIDGILLNELNVFLDSKNDETINKYENFETKIAIETENYINKKYNKPQIYQFHENEFILLRKVYKNSAVFNLVMHCETFYIFLQKLFIFPNDKDQFKYEIDFCKNHNHGCFARFYGFIEKNEQIAGFIYEFMCNGSLLDFVNLHPNKIDKIYSLLVTTRIFEGIEYLQSIIW